MNDGSTNELVVGLDGSEQSRLALRWAAAVAEPAGLPLRAVEAWSYPKLSVVSGAGDLAGPEEMDRRTIEDLRAVVTEELGEIPPFVEAQALRGPAAGALLQVVTARSVLVLGARGLGGFAGLLLGSVSRECAEHAPCPVVVAKDDRPPAPGSLVLVGKDGSEGGVKALEWAASLGELTGAEVATVFAWEPSASEVRPRLAERLQAGAEAAVEEWTESVTEGVRALEVEGDPRDKVVELAERTKAALVVVGREGASRRGGGVGKVAAHVVQHSPTGVAVVPVASGGQGGA